MSKEAFDALEEFSNKDDLSEVDFITYSSTLWNAQAATNLIVIDTIEKIQSVLDEVVAAKPVYNVTVNFDNKVDADEVGKAIQKALKKTTQHHV